jgi:hypothetical protein
MVGRLGFSLLPGVRAGVGLTHGPSHDAEDRLHHDSYDFGLLDGVNCSSFFYAYCEDEAIEYWFANPTWN